MNFQVVEGCPSFWDQKAEFVNLYNDHVPISEIRSQLDLTPVQHMKLVRECSEEGLIKPRRVPKRTKRRVKNYHFNSTSNKFQVRHSGKYYGSYKTKELVELAVQIAREHNWEISIAELRRLVDARR